MFVISSGFAYIAFLMCVSGLVLAAEKYTKWKVFNLIPPLVWIFALNAVFCTMGVFSGKEISLVYSGLKDNLLYAMMFVMLLRCDFRKLSRLGGRIIAVFFTCSITLAVGTIAGFPLFSRFMGGAENTWAAVAALYALWVGGAGNMTSMVAAFDGSLSEGTFGAALALDTVCYALWISLLLLGVRYASKWNAAVKADATKLNAVAQEINAKTVRERRRATSADWSLLIGLSLAVSYLSQKVGVILNDRLCAAGVTMLSAPFCAALFVSVLGLLCALTPLSKLPAAEELSGVYLYAIVALLASQADLSSLTTAPAWILFGLVILLIHLVLMFLLSKLFHWDLCTVSTASLANVGGAASAHIIASAYDPSLVGIGVLMGLLGGAVGNFFGMGMGMILQALFV